MNLKKLRSLMIGSNVEVIESKNKTLVGLKGKVIDQTKNTMTIETKKGNKRIITSHARVKNEKD